MEKQFDARDLARQLEQAWQTRQPLAPFTETGAIGSVEEAYAVQSEWETIRLAAGDRILGRKVGLTSQAMQKQFGVTEPDFGRLLESRYYPAQDGRARIPIAPFLQARIEGEIAFRISEPLAGPGVTAEQVLGATGGLALAAEIIDSRLEDWRIKLIDTVADNGSFGGFTHGPWDDASRGRDLPDLRLVIKRNGAPIEEGLGSAVLGHPANSVAWLINKLSEFGVALDSGDIILSGSLVASIPANGGDEFSLELAGQPALTVKFE